MIIKQQVAHPLHISSKISEINLEINTALATSQQSHELKIKTPCGRFYQINFFGLGQLSLTEFAQSGFITIFCSPTFIGVGLFRQIHIFIYISM